MARGHSPGRLWHCRASLLVLLLASLAALIDPSASAFPPPAPAKKLPPPPPPKPSPPKPSPPKPSPPKPSPPPAKAPACTPPSPPSCKSPEQVCNGICSNIQIDYRNCGKCGVMCPTNMTCYNGKCQCQQYDLGCLSKSCNGASQRNCGGYCTDIGGNDNFNCGTCAQACPSGTSCKAGRCICDGSGLPMCSRSPLLEAVAKGPRDYAVPSPPPSPPSPPPPPANPLGQYCPNFFNDSSNCGGCGNRCNTKGKTVCSNGVCVCPPGQADCGTGICSSINVAQQCGSCNTVCIGGTDCFNMTCACPPKSAWCSGLCTPVSDTFNCGGICGNVCSGGKVCAFQSFFPTQTTRLIGNPGTFGSYQCVCPSGQKDCNGVCVDLKTDSSNCGSCSTKCRGSAFCLQGQCRLFDPCLFGNC